ncbi:hypothetical protein Cha6605_5586 [Chamaesiphon minutus PCC 6605]|uniref:Uncharacterized protein n=1 Tax=Chamaesiphon minutus (strain ATCC 27169 / PCC 6605) TaxID=1173020 RepID=K9UPV0_CHAP6|nr:hypothetical protein Cha6605_5586 [Chamaesiphon minutus PCC 6605]
MDREWCLVSFEAFWLDKNMILFYRAERSDKIAIISMPSERLSAFIEVAIGAEHRFW